MSVSIRAKVIEGLFWNTMYQVVHALSSFGAMLVLVRLIPPFEYGRVATVVGMLAFVNAFNCNNFIRHSLQLPEEQEPAWSDYWSVAFYIQLAACLVCQAIAGCCWIIPAYAPVAVLLHIAGVGLMIEIPNRIGANMLFRELDFRRVRMLSALALVVNLAVSIGFALIGKGAYGIILGANVLPGIPGTIYLLCVRRWRPDQRWWALRGWRCYKTALRFGLLQSSATLLTTGRSIIEAGTLPLVVGFSAMGLWNRGQALYTSSVGRVAGVVSESIYPILPRYNAMPLRYAQYASLFVRALVWTTLPGAIFVYFEGTNVMRLLYGAKWLAAVPLIAPGAAAGFGVSLFSAGYTVLVAANRLRTCFLLDVSLAAASISSLLALALGYSMADYAWTIAVATLSCGAVALSCSAALLPRRWLADVVYAPVVSTVAACISTLPIGYALRSHNVALQVLCTAFVFVIVFVCVLRLVAGSALAELVMTLPGGAQIRSALRLNPSLEKATA